MNAVRPLLFLVLLWAIFVALDAPAPKIPPTAPAAATSPEELPVEQRIKRLKALKAITPTFCKLIDRPCRSRKAAIIDRGIDQVLERCGALSHGSPFDICLHRHLGEVLQDLKARSTGADT